MSSIHHKIDFVVYSFKNPRDREREREDFVHCTQILDPTLQPNLNTWQIVIELHFTKFIYLFFDSDILLTSSVGSTCN